MESIKSRTFFLKKKRWRKSTFFSVINAIYYRKSKRALNTFNDWNECKWNKIETHIHTYTYGRPIHPTVPVQLNLFNCYPWQYFSLTFWSILCSQKINKKGYIFLHPGHSVCSQWHLTIWTYYLYIHRSTDIYIYKNIRTYIYIYV